MVNHIHEDKKNEFSKYTKKKGGVKEIGISAEVFDLWNEAVPRNTSVFIILSA